jgi:hypothetical protein
VQLIEAPALQLYRYCRGAGGASKQQLLWLVTWVRWSRSPFFNQYSDIQYVTVCREPEPELEELHQTMPYSENMFRSPHRANYVPDSGRKEVNVLRDAKLQIFKKSHDT